MLESLFNKGAESDSNTGVFLWNFWKFLRTLILKNIKRLFLHAVAVVFKPRFFTKWLFSSNWPYNDACGTWNSNFYDVQICSKLTTTTQHQKNFILPFLWIWSMLFIVLFWRTHGLSLGIFMLLRKLLSSSFEKIV